MEVTTNQSAQNTMATLGTATSEVGKGAISSDFETFLKMLTVQMTNQDPLNPIDSADYAVQLATFSGVEQQVRTNDLLTALSSQIGTSGMAQMAAWVGKEARVASSVYFDGDPVTISPNPAAIADQVELVVYDENGLEVQRRSLPVSADPIQWNGTDLNGEPLPDGVYSLHIVSSAGGEVLIDDIAEIYARIEEVRVEGGETVLMLEGGVPVLASSITALRDSALL